MRHFRYLGRSGGEGGYTLIEVIVAMFMFTAFAASSLTMIGVIFKANSYSRGMSEAIAASESKLEELRNLGYDSISSGSDTTSSGYERTWVVEQDVPINWVSRVTLTTGWTDKQGQRHHIQTVTLISR